MSAGQTNSTATGKTVQTVNPNRNKMPTAVPIIANGQSQIHERQRPRLIVSLVGFNFDPYLVLTEKFPVRPSTVSGRTGSTARLVLKFPFMLSIVEAFLDFFSEN